MLRTVVGALQHYDWGDTTALPRLLQREADGKPWAEMWFGTHETAEAHLDDATPLEEITGDMTMLVKLLACAKPLSLQTHPTLEQAFEGFAREEVRQFSGKFNHPPRNYRDNSDKPEMLIAFESFEALCGFAPINNSVALLLAMGWAAEAQALEDNGIDGYLVWAFEQETAPLMQHAPEWLQKIANLHPNDKCLRIAPLLNHVVLQPGEAISLPAGNLHAYLRGMGLEVMKSSDNVIRAGFTSKHVDVPELLRIVDTNELLQPVVRATSLNGIASYPSPSDAFSVAAYDSAVVTELAASSSHRLIFGHFDTAPSMKLLVAGESASLPANAGTFWVCTQN